MDDVDKKIGLAKDLFSGWSSGDADGPIPFYSEDAVLEDVAGGTFRGIAEIRKFAADGVDTCPDLKFDPHTFWTNENGVALTWTMTGTVASDRFGRTARGKFLTYEGISILDIRDGKIVYEKDLYDSAAIAAALGLPGPNSRERLTGK